ncbi:MAG: MFS transporter [Mycobacteriaceae bacterium]|nr:MFS transporter [Mycobacteriaceae bacterium]
MTQLTSGDARAGSHGGAVLAVVAVGILLSSLDLFIVNVALPSIAADFGAGELSGLSWVLNAYAIVFAALLVPAGRLGDRSGNKAMFLTGLAVFLVGSGLCATAGGVWPLVAFRAVQAVGGAMMIPSSLALVLAATAAQRRPAAVRLWVAFGGLGAVLGPVFGGLLVELSWRWVFLVNLPIGVIALYIGVRMLPNPPGDAGTLPDIAGALLLIASTATVVTALVKGNDWGWASIDVVVLLGIAALSVPLMVAVSARRPNPVVDPALLRAPNFALMAVNAMLFNAAFGGMILTVALWMQTVWGWSALRTGLAIAPGPLLVPVVAILAGRLIAKVGAGVVIAVGGVAFAVGSTWWAAAVELHADYPGAILGGMLVTGLGVGLALPSAFAAGTSGLPPLRFATGSAVLSMARQIGLALGVAVIVAVLGHPSNPAATLDAFHQCWWVIAGISVASSVVALGTKRA